MNSISLIKGETMNISINIRPSDGDETAFRLPDSKGTAKQRIHLFNDNPIDNRLQTNDINRFAIAGTVFKPGETPEIKWYETGRFVIVNFDNKNKNELTACKININSLKKRLGISDQEFDNANKNDTLQEVISKKLNERIKEEVQEHAEDLSKIITDNKPDKISSVREFLERNVPNFIKKEVLNKFIEWVSNDETRFKSFTNFFSSFDPKGKQSNLFRDIRDGCQTLLENENAPQRFKTWYGGGEIKTKETETKGNKNIQTKKELISDEDKKILRDFTFLNPSAPNPSSTLTAETVKNQNIKPPNIHQVPDKEWETYSKIYDMSDADWEAFKKGFEPDDELTPQDYEERYNSAKVKAQKKALVEQFVGAQDFAAINSASLETAVDELNKLINASVEPEKIKTMLKNELMRERDSTYEKNLNDVQIGFLLSNATDLKEIAAILNTTGNQNRAGELFIKCVPSDKWEAVLNELGIQDPKKYVYSEYDPHISVKQAKLSTLFNKIHDVMNTEQQEKYFPPWTHESAGESYGQINPLNFRTIGNKELNEFKNIFKPLKEDPRYSKTPEEYTKQYNLEKEKAQLESMNKKITAFSRIGQRFLDIKTASLYKREDVKLTPDQEHILAKRFKELFTETINSMPIETEEQIDRKVEAIHDLLKTFGSDISITKEIVLEKKAIAGPILKNVVKDFTDLIKLSDKTGDLEERLRKKIINNLSNLGLLEVTTAEIGFVLSSTKDPSEIANILSRYKDNIGRLFFTFVPKEMQPLAIEKLLEKVDELKTFYEKGALLFSISELMPENEKQLLIKKYPRYFE